MSLNLNSVTLAGRLTRDPELKSVGERFVAHLGVAINRRYKDRDGNLKEDVTFVDVSVWGKTAENCNTYLSKGSAVYIEGYLKLDEWKTKEGQPRQMLKVEAHNVQFLDQKKADDAPAATPRSVTNAKDPFSDEPPF
jgi:single-strand DNA-binding protein